jgi:hypothetical protein
MDPWKECHLTRNYGIIFIAQIKRSIKNYNRRTGGPA